MDCLRHPSPCPAPLHLLISARVETSQQNTSCLDLGKIPAQNLRSRPSRILLPCPCLQLTLKHWEDSWELQFNFKENMNCRYWISNSEDPLFYAVPAMYIQSCIHTHTHTHTSIHSLVNPFFSSVLLFQCTVLLIYPFVFHDTQMVRRPG